MFKGENSCIFNIQIMKVIPMQANENHKYLGSQIGSPFFDIKEKATKRLKGISHRKLKLFSVTICSVASHKSKMKSPDKPEIKNNVKSNHLLYVL